MAKSSEVQVEVCTITPEQAEALLKKNIKGNSKRFTVSHCKRLAAIIVDGKWELTNDAISVDSRGRLINGQHRLTACVMAQKPIQVLVASGMSGKAFACMDNGLARSAAHVLAIDGDDNPKELATALRLLAGRLQGKGILTGKLSNQDTLSVLGEHPDIADSVTIVCDINQRFDGALKQLLNLGVVACFHYLMCNTGVIKKKVDDFWATLADHEIEGKDNPPIRLRLNLTKNLSADEKVGREIIHGWIVLAFQAWMADEKLPTLKCQKGEYPVLGGLDVDPDEADEEQEEEKEPKETKPKRRKKVVEATTTETESEPEPETTE